jgi:hypothetical protein
VWLFLFVGLLQRLVHPVSRNIFVSNLIMDYVRDLAAINEFLFYMEAEPFITPEKAENYKRVVFKKVKTE